jgi:steroid delta-isomerase-like uncharacterized protein
MSEANKAIARRYYSEIMNGANQTTIDELMSSDFLFINPTYPLVKPGLEGFKKLITMLHGAFLDLYFNIEHLLAEGETVTIHSTAQGEHRGSLHTVMGDIPASGKPFKVSSITWLHIADGKIRSARVDEDSLGLLMQLGAIPTEAAPNETPCPEANKAIVNRYFNEIMSQGRLEVIDELMAEDFIIRISSLHEPFHGPEGMKQFVTGLRTAFPDIEFTVEEQIAEGDQVACRFTSISTHQGEFAGISPTGKQVKDHGTDIFRFVSGKIAEVWVSENALGLMQQIGAIPTPE